MPAAKQKSGVLGGSLELYVTEAELAAYLNQTPAEWKAKVKILEREGFPRIDPLLGARYLPAVKAYFDQRHGLRTVIASTPDGKENLDALTR